MTTRPFSVPNFGLSARLALVGTRSTTGTPRRQMVTFSPSSAALISSGSLFLASATLTFIYTLWLSLMAMSISVFHLLQWRAWVWFWLVAICYCYLLTRRA